MEAVLSVDGITDPLYRALWHKLCRLCPHKLGRAVSGGSVSRKRANWAAGLDHLNQRASL